MRNRAAHPQDKWEGAIKDADLCSQRFQSSQVLQHMHGRKHARIPIVLKRPLHLLTVIHFLQRWLIRGRFNSEMVTAQFVLAPQGSLTILGHIS